ncbi:tetratricopeptide repeat protein [Bryobacter aggregatus]|uniref:tetratricopeptide repeat protein n=1 Tax=Bryobacter aggregatus TaxID=360054 RepID=UPI0004E20EB4|nr:tetratricopeptide repeat protein [Bryobacter aggregatus]
MALFEKDTMLQAGFMLLALVLLTTLDPAPEAWISQQNEQAHKLYLAAQYDEAEKMYRETLPYAGGHQRAVLLNNLGMLLRDRGNLKEAFPVIEEALALRERQLGRTHPDTLICLSNLASLEGKSGNWRRAGLLYREVLESRPGDAGSLINVALIEKQEGNYAASLTHLNQARLILEKTPDASYRALIAVYNNLASQLNLIHEGKLARKYLNQALHISLARQGTTHPTYALLLESQAAIEITTKHYREARLAAQQALAILEQHHSADNGRVLKLLAWIDFYEGHREAAEAGVATALPKLQRQPSEIADAHDLLAQLELKQKRQEQAIAHLEQGLAASPTSGLLLLYAQLMRQREHYGEAAKAEQQMVTIETKASLARAAFSKSGDHFSSGPAASRW